MVDRMGGPRSEQRRKALRRFFEAHGMNARETAVRAGFKNANTIYNFLSGRSASLNTETYQALVSVVSGATMSDILGEKDLSSSANMSPLVVRGVAAVGVWSESGELPYYEQFQTAVPVPASMVRGLYGLLVRGDAMDFVYPDGSLVAVRSLDAFGHGVDTGHRVVVQRFRDGLVETSLREIVDVDGGVRLVSRSSNPRHLVAIDPDADWREGGRFKDAAGISTQVSAVVIGGYVAEPKVYSLMDLA